MHLRDIFFRNLYSEFKKGNKKRFIIVTNDFGAPFLDKVRKDFPNYYLNAGICEQNIVTLSAGLAKEGFYPIIYSISSFILYRSFEQIKLDLCVHNVKCCLLTVGSGYAYDVDGPTHHTTEDLSVMYNLPNMKIFSPLNSEGVNDDFKQIKQSKCVSWFRLDRGSFNNKFNTNNTNGINYLKINKSQNLIISTGTTSYSFMDRIVTKNLNISALNINILKPLNINYLKKILSKYKNIFVVEEHSEILGLYSIIVSNLNLDDFRNKKIFKFGIKQENMFAYGKREILRKINFIDTEQIIKFIRKVVN
jgi:transketolase